MTSPTILALIKFLAARAADLGVAKYVYVVGGAVRDFVLNVPIKDVDVVIDTVASGKNSGDFARCVAAAAPGSNLIVNNYGVAILTIGRCRYEGQNLKGMVVEIADARKESYGEASGKGYKPHMVEPATIREDVLRREFRFNTLLWSMAELTDGPEGARIFDLTGEGLNDLRSSPVQMICPTMAEKVFTDDPTRMLRAIKFGLRFNAGLGQAEQAAICWNAPCLAKVPHNALASILIHNLFEVDVLKSIEWLNYLLLTPVIKQVMESEPAFKTTLTNWARTRPFAMIALVYHARLPVSGGLDQLVWPEPLGHTTQGMQAIADVLDTFTREGGRGPEIEAKALKFLEALRQPGRVMDTEALIAQRGLKGAEIRALTQEAREALLKNPQLMEGGLGEALGL